MNEQYISLEDFQRNLDLINFGKNCPNPNSLMNEKELIKMIKEVRFSIIELSLYLDTHPNDKRAIELHKEHANKLKKLSDEYEKMYGPLSIMCPCNKWRWIEEPWPWENTNSCGFERGDA